MGRRVVFVILLLGASYIHGTAQDVFQEMDCAALLSNAENEFAAGRFYGIPTLLKDCIDRNQFSNEEKLRVYMLLAQVYLLTDDPVAAEESYLKLLAANPEYIPSVEGDPIDIVYLSKKFTTTPIFTPHFKAGMNYSNQSSIFEITSVSKPDSVDKKRIALPGFTLGGGVEWNITEKLGIGGEILVAYKSYAEKYTGIFGSDVRNATEKQWWVDIPFYIRYGSNTGKLRPYGYAGYAVNLLVQDKLELLATDIDKSEGSSKNIDVAGPDLKVLYKRHILNGSVLLGGGVKYKFGRNFFLLDARIMAGLTNILKEELSHYAGKNSYEWAPELARYGSIDNIMRVNNVALTLGFVRPLYDPRRLDRARTKSVSRKLSRE